MAALSAKLSSNTARSCVVAFSAPAALRARAFFSFEGKRKPHFWLMDQSKAKAAQSFPIPMPVGSKPLEKLSVTYFKEFLKCPYRFYLSRIMKLRPMSDRLDHT